MMVAAVTSLEEEKVRGLCPFRVGGKSQRESAQAYWAFLSCLRLIFGTYVP